VLTILRQSHDALTTREIAAQMILERALDASDQKLLALMVRRVGSALRHQRDKDRVKSTEGPGNYQLWTVARLS
jgi:hypothetical protein